MLQSHFNFAYEAELLKYLDLKKLQSCPLSI